MRASEARLGAIIGSTMDAIVCVDGEHRVVVFNPAAERMFRCPAADVLGGPLERFLPPRFRSGHAEHLRAFGGFGPTSAPAQMHGMLWGLRADGEEFPMEATLSRAQVGGGQLYTAVIRDISERVRAEEALRESEARFRTLADSAPVLVWMSDAAGNCVFVSRAWLESTGRTLQQARGKGWLECVHPDDAARLAPQYAVAVATHSRFEFEYRLRQRDGTFRWVLDAGRPRFGPDGAFAGYVGSCADIHAMREAEEARERLHRAQEGTAARERAFLRDVLFSVTEGRLRLCDGPADLPVRLTPVGEEIAVTLPELATLRRRVREAAKELAFPDVRLFDIMSAASECAMNSVQHGGGIALARLCAGPGQLKVWIEDRGKGIDLSALPRATLLKGHSGAGGFGHGFFLMLQACDKIHLLTGPRGTTIVLEQGREEPPEREWPSF
jgi:PAS domain S-box-containing protein